MKICITLVFSIIISYQAFSYDNLIIFGDSLSDAGNIQYSDSIYGRDDPNHLSYGGRWTNGEVWNEYLARKLNMKVPAKSSNYKSGENISEGNTNFAHAGAWTYGSTIPKIYSIDQQISYDSNQSFSRYNSGFGGNDLVAIWGGANDYLVSQIFFDYEAKNAAKLAAEKMAANVESLISLGAKNILVLNLPNIGKTPDYVNTKWEAQAKLYSDTFNSDYKTRIANIQATHLDVKLFEIDIYSLFADIYENHDEYGIENVTSQLKVDYANDHTIDVDTYMFFDGEHPTTITHSILADKIYAQIIPEPSTYAFAFSVFALCFTIYWRRKL